MVTGGRFADAEGRQSLSPRPVADRPLIFCLERPMNVFTRFARTVRGWHRPLVLHASVMFGLALFAAVGVFADDRLLLGEPVWAKPMKFGVAMGAYSLTLAWLLTRLTKGRRIGWWVGTVFALAGVLDVGAVTWAAAHGTFSHFNRDTDDV